MINPVRSPLSYFPPDHKAEKEKSEVIANPLDLSKADQDRFLSTALTGALNLCDRDILPKELSIWIRLARVTYDVGANRDEYNDLLGKINFPSSYKPIAASVLAILKLEGLRRIYSHPRLAPVLLVASAVSTCVVGARAISYLKKCLEVGTKDDWAKILTNTLVHATNVSHSAYNTGSIYSFVMGSVFERGNVIFRHLDNERENKKMSNKDFACKVLDLKCDDGVPSTKEISKRYKDLALIYHPDKVHDSSMKEAADGSFKILKNAKDILQNMAKADTEVSKMREGYFNMLNPDEVGRIFHGNEGMYYADRNLPGDRSIRAACQVVDPVCKEIDDLWDARVKDEKALEDLLTSSAPNLLDTKLNQLRNFFDESLDPNDLGKKFTAKISLAYAELILNQLKGVRGKELTKGIVSSSFTPEKRPTSV